jgi:hypothetical protein
MEVPGMLSFYVRGSLGSRENFFREKIFFSGSPEVYQDQHSSHVFHGPDESSFSRQQHTGFLRTNGFTGRQRIACLHDYLRRAIHGCFAVALSLRLIIVS